MLLLFILCIPLSQGRVPRNHCTTVNPTKDFLYPWEIPFGTRASAETLEFSDTEPPEPYWNNTFPTDPDLTKMSEEYVPRTDENHTEDNLIRRLADPFILNVTHEMTLDYIVPFAIPVGPKEFANVSFKTTAKPWAGTVFPRVAIKGIPTIQWSCNLSAYYTIFVTNLEGKFKNNINKTKNIYFNERHHWLVYNIPKCTISKGEVLIKYLAPINEKTHEYYLYVILVYEQKTKLQIDRSWRSTPPYPITTPSTTVRLRTDGIYLVDPRWKVPPDWNRVAFKIREFAEKYDLGSPQAGNHFYVHDIDFKPFTRWEDKTDEEIAARIYKKRNW